MRYSHLKHIEKRIQEALLALVSVDGFPRKELARLGGCSLSTINSYMESCERANGCYLFAMAYGLAEEYDNYRLQSVLMPTGARITVVDLDGVAANGCLLDEAADITKATALFLVGGGDAGDADAIAEARAQLVQIVKRLEAEELLRRAQTAPTGRVRKQRAR
jgi:hypothetical protein